MSETLCCGDIEINVLKKSINGKLEQLKNVVKENQCLKDFITHRGLSEEYRVFKEYFYGKMKKSKTGVFEKKDLFEPR